MEAERCATANTSDLHYIFSHSLTLQYERDAVSGKLAVRTFLALPTQRNLHTGADNHGVVAEGPIPNAVTSVQMAESDRAPSDDFGVALRRRHPDPDGRWRLQRLRPLRHTRLRHRREPLVEGPAPGDLLPQPLSRHSRPAAPRRVPANRRCPARVQKGPSAPRGTATGQGRRPQGLREGRQSAGRPHEPDLDVLQLPRLLLSRGGDRPLEGDGSSDPRD